MSIDHSFSQTNKSPTKATYTFPKANRLAHLNRPYCTSLYDIPTTLSKRSTSIGYGKRSRGMESKSPAPGQYDQSFNTLQFDGRKRGFTIGVGREVESQIDLQAQSQGIIATFKTDSPGPGLYIPKTTLSTVGYTISTKPKYGGIADLAQRNGVPGPGQYVNLPRLNPDGRYPQSGMKNTRSIIFNRQGGTRFVGDGREYVPGPGTYSINLKDDHGKYNLSTIKNPRLTIIPRSIEIKRLMRSSSLGPGSYDVPSEFGNGAASPKPLTHKK